MNDASEYWTMRALILLISLGISGSALAAPKLPLTCNTAAASAEMSRELLSRAHHEHEDGDHAEAWKTYWASIERDPCNGGAWTGLGAVLLDQNQPQEALKALGRAIALNPSDARSWVLLGRTREAFQDYASAAKAYQRALEAQPGDRSAQNAYARLVMLQG